MRLSEIRAGQTERPHKAPSLAGLERIAHLTYEGREGKRQATLTLRLLDTSARISRDIACARLAAPARFDELPTAAQLRIWAHATLAFSLQEPPAWLEEALDYDEALVMRLYEEVARHEAAFFRGDVGEGEEEARGPRVELRALDLTSDAPPR